MTQVFASVELARIYENQGYLEDALAIYKSLDTDVLKGGAGVRAAVQRLEVALLERGGSGASKAAGNAAPASLVDDWLPKSFGDALVPETDAAAASNVKGLLEQWLTLVVIQHQLKSLKRIGAYISK